MTPHRIKAVDINSGRYTGVVGHWDYDLQEQGYHEGDYYLDKKISLKDLARLIINYIFR